MIDVLIAGAGPAGSIAALALARAGARVTLIDRATFPRHKLCGDTLNPGTMAILDRLGLAGPVVARALPIAGMVLTGEDGQRIEGRYPRGAVGRAIRRCDLDAGLLDAAVTAGARLESGVVAREPARDRTGLICGLRIAAGARAETWPARYVIAADGRRSTLAFGLKLARHPARPRRWAIGAYFYGVEGCGSLGEMHVRGSHYLGVAPLPGGLTNACLVIEPARHAGALGDPGATLRRAIELDPRLRDRFARAEPAAPAVTLGPLAVDGLAAGIPGLVTAGDASGFVDPMTGDGLRFAIRGGELAADAVLESLADGRHAAHVTLARRRAREFGGKYLFNRAVRRLVASPAAIRAAALGARVAPWMIEAAVMMAGDVRLAGSAPAGSA